MQRDQGRLLKRVIELFNKDFSLLFLLQFQTNVLKRLVSERICSNQTELQEKLQLHSLVLLQVRPS